jgi:ParB family transcriptional regulator, chromosome partitioning protein
MPIKSVSIDNIKYGSNRRPVNDEKVKELKDSIQANGLLNPITVDSKLNLIAGLHRLTACKQLGLETIDCNVVDYDDDDQSRLAEIDENFIRNELDILERAELLLERERILDRLGLRAKPGDNQYTYKGRETVSQVPKTTTDLAREIGYSERSLQHDKQIARDIHSYVKEQIKGTPLSNMKTELLKIARTAGQERAFAKQAEVALEAAKAKGDEEEALRQARNAAHWRSRQQEIQAQAMKSSMAKAKRDAKLTFKDDVVQPEQQIQKVTMMTNQVSVKAGEEWKLGQHTVCCSHTYGEQFTNLLPNRAALAIATLSPTWNHDYLIDRARIVAVLRSEGYVYEFYRRQRMPFQYELILGNIYVGLFSREAIAKPQAPINIDGVEGIVNYLLHLYTNPTNSVIAPFMGHGEILITCERMGRICFIGDENAEVVSRGIIRWQAWSGKQAQKIESQKIESLSFAHN